MREESTDFMTEAFEVNETDLEYALNPGTYRRQTKEERIYGNLCIICKINALFVSIQG